MFSVVSIDSNQIHRDSEINTIGEWLFVITHLLSLHDKFKVSMDVAWKPINKMVKTIFFDKQNCTK